MGIFFKQAIIIYKQLLNIEPKARIQFMLEIINNKP
jgi:hypothetical protein